MQCNETLKLDVISLNENLNNKKRKIIQKTSNLIHALESQSNMKKWIKLKY